MAKVAKRYCGDCDSYVRSTTETPNNFMHLILTILTAGIWLVVWLVKTLDGKDWRCDDCGSKTKARKSIWS